MADDPQRPRGRNATGGWHQLAPGEYAKMSIAEKQAIAREEREAPCRCPRCDAGLPADQLAAHLESRCTGRARPPRHARYLDIRGIRALGLAPTTVRRWARDGLVRGDGRQWLARDVTQAFVWWRRLRGRR